MFAKLTLGFRMVSGFAVLLVLFIFLGVVANVKMTEVVIEATKLQADLLPRLEMENSFERKSSAAILAMQSFVSTEEEKHFERGRQKLSEIDHLLEMASVLVEKSDNVEFMKAAVTKVVEKKKLFDGLAGETRKKMNDLRFLRGRVNEDSLTLKEHMDAFVSNQHDLLNTEVRQKGDSGRILDLVRQISVANEILAQGRFVQQANLRAHAAQDPEKIQKILADLAQVIEKIEVLRKSDSQVDLVSQLDKTRNAGISLKNGLSAVLNSFREFKMLEERLMEAGEIMLSGAQEIALGGVVDAKKMASRAVESLDLASKIMIWGLLCAIVLGVSIATAITRSLTGPLKIAVEQMSVGAEQVAIASAQISSSSQQLAGGASEQASSLEEFSATLEELSSQARNNLEKVCEATEGAEQAKEAAEKADEAMVQTVQSMADIKESSGRISGIIKTIEEIAFQTNLLALNAAVEAARAGEHGRGFAVVADEVRNLAQRSAIAAKDSAALIESSLKQANRGTEVVKNASESITRILSITAGVAESARQMNTASKEQFEGIAQINNTVSEMDKVTQSLAANAEESAAASEELHAQAFNMKEIVNSLKTLIQGSVSEAPSLVVDRMQGNSPTRKVPYIDLESESDGFTSRQREKQVKQSGRKNERKKREDFGDF